MNSPRVPFSRAPLVGNELEYVAEAIASRHLASGGPFSERCSKLLEEMLGAPRVLLTTSCTAALEMSALLLGIGEGDEVLLPSFSFVSTASAFLLRGARPVFVDIDPRSLNLDLGDLRSRITDRTRAIVTLHYAGSGSEIEALASLAEERGVPLIEDNAVGLFGKYRGRPLGSFGCLSALSFHETKNLTCGEGGALVINDAALVERAEIILEKGTDRARFLRGVVDKYTWVDLGSSNGMSDILAAFLLAQLEKIDEVQQRRQLLWERYLTELATWATEQGVELPVIPEHSESSYHTFHLLFPEEAQRDAFMAFARARGVSAVFHYLPLHLSTVGRGLGGRRGDCPVTEKVCARLARLPLFDDLSAADQERVISVTRSFTG
jgi:dTDP-4-amino-4,6-dideoxygalactose transaminase